MRPRSKRKAAIQATRQVQQVLWPTPEAQFTFSMPRSPSKEASITEAHPSLWDADIHKDIHIYNFLGVSYYSNDAPELGTPGPVEDRLTGWIPHGQDDCTDYKPLPLGHVVPRALVKEWKLVVKALAASPPPHSPSSQDNDLPTDLQPPFTQAVPEVKIGFPSRRNKAYVAVPRAPSWVKLSKRSKPAEVEEDSPAEFEEASPSDDEYQAKRARIRKGKAREVDPAEGEGENKEVQAAKEVVKDGNGDDNAAPINVDDQDDTFDENLDEKFEKARAPGGRPTEAFKADCAAGGAAIARIMRKIKETHGTTEQQVFAGTGFYPRSGEVRGTSVWNAFLSCFRLCQPPEKGKHGKFSIYWLQYHG